MLSCVSSFGSVSASYGSSPEIAPRTRYILSRDFYPKGCQLLAKELTLSAGKQLSRTQNYSKRSENI